MDLWEVHFCPHCTYSQQFTNKHDQRPLIAIVSGRKSNRLKSPFLMTEKGTWLCNIYTDYCIPGHCFIL